MMKRNLLILFALGLTAGLFAQPITYTTTHTDVTCFGGNDGSATITSITGFGFYNSSTKGLLISEVYADPTSIDSSHEFVELVATRFIDFSVNPYTVIVCNNNTATSAGWIAGTSKTYAYSITSGTVNGGEVVYVGGSTMIPLTNRLRVINSAVTGGDGGIGSAAAAGVFGNGGVSCDGVAVFNVGVASITSSTVPIDAVFYGAATGAAVVAGGTQGYELPINDTYAGGKLQTASVIQADLPTDKILKASFGIYNVFTNTWTTPRTWVTVPNSSFTNLTSSVLLDRLYNVSWSNACTSVYNPNLTAGTYTFTITDQFANLVSGNVVVANGPVVDLGATASDLFACTGDVVNLSASNADSYLWNTGDTISNPSITVTGDTLLIVIGTDTTTGCVSPDSVFIDVNAYPVISFSLPNDTACNDNGIINLSATPAGGTFAGTSVAGSTLDPSLLLGAQFVTYTYADANGCSSVDTANYFVLDCTGIENIDENLATIYPNPTTNYLIISSEKEGLQFSISDMQGKMIRNGMLSTGKMIEVSDLTNGFYVITIYNKEAKKHMKFLKQ